MIALFWSSPAFALPAFPGAEGFGAAATGGRGGRVVHVTTLAESGPGSLRAALETDGPRVVVFDVSGVIDLGAPNCRDAFDESDGSNVLVIRHPDLTIAGQTAPGGGVTLRGRLYADFDERVSNVVVRHLRIRPAPYDCPGGDGEQYDALRFAVNDRALFDHVSVSWGVDENVDTWKARHLTVQWSIVAEGATEGHPEGRHNYGLLNDAGPVSILNDLFAHDINRNPALSTGPGEVVNTVAYNVRHGLVNHNPAQGDFNVIGNVYVRGPDDDLHPFFLDGGSGASWWFADTRVDDPGRLVGVVDDPFDDPYFTMGVSPSVRADAPFDFSAEPGWVRPTVASSADARERVLARAGAFPRDVVDRRIVADVDGRTGAWGARQVDDLFEGLTAAPPPEDTDGDGMPDAWEVANGLDPDDAGDPWTELDGGWPALEVYLACRADTLLDPAVDCASGPAPRGGGGGRGCDTGGGGAGWLVMAIVGLLARSRGVGAAALLAACLPTGGGPRPDGSGDTGADAPGGGIVTWTDEGEVFRRGVGASDEVERVGSGRWLVPSPSGAWLAWSTDRPDGEILVLRAADGGDVEEVRPDGAAVYLEGMPAVSDDGDTVVFAASGGPNAIDLFVTTRAGDGSWSRPEVLTTGSPRPYNNQPSWSRDGAAVLFNCGRERDPESGDNDACRVALDGGAVEVVVAHDVLPDGRNPFVNFPRDAGGGRVVFEGSWPQGGGQPPETLWERRGGAAPEPAVTRTFDNTVSPCVLGDGSIVALWLGRPGGTGAHELTWIGDGDDSVTLLADVDIDDIGIGCTTR